MIFGYARACAAAVLGITKKRIWLSWPGRYWCAQVWFSSCAHAPS